MQDALQLRLILNYFTFFHVLTDRKTDREKERQNQRQKDSQKDRQKDKHKDRQTNRKTDKKILVSSMIHLGTSLSWREGEKYFTHFKICFSEKSKIQI